jgi:hypothetical protein
MMLSEIRFNYLPYGGIFFATLHSAEVGAINTGVESKPLLRNPSGDANPSHITPD